MKPRMLFVLLGLTLITTLYAQEEEKNTPEQELFEQGVQFFESSDYLGAAATFRKFMIEYPKSELKPRAHYNLALTYFYANDFESSSELFEEILDQPYNEQDENNIMEPYALYKHHSCRFLAEMALQEEKFDDAARYIQLFDKKYPYQHFCGNEWSAYDMYVAVMKARVSEGRGETKKAIETLVPYIFDDGLASNDWVLEKLGEVLEKHYTKEQLKDEFQRAVSSLEVRSGKKNRGGYITLYGKEVRVRNWYVDEDLPKPANEMDRYRHAVENNELFKKYL